MRHPAKDNTQEVDEMNETKPQRCRLYWDKRADGVNYLTGNCISCGAPFMSDNTYAASYCPPCAEKIRREKTAARTQLYKARKKQAAKAQGPAATDKTI